MRYFELIELLKNITHKNIRQADLVEATGVTRATMSYRAKNNSIFPLEDIIKINNFFNIDLFTNCKNTDVNSTNSKDSFIADYYTEITGCTKNNELLGIKSKLSIPKNIINSYSPDKTYIVINAIGDSMLPKIQDKDKLLIEKEAIMPNEILDNRIYFFSFEQKFFVKRLILNVNQIVIKSDNKEPVYSLITLQNNEINNINIIGKAIGLLRNLD